MERKRITFNCDTDVEKWIKQDAEQKRSTPSHVIRTILFKHYDKRGGGKPPKKEGG